MLMNYRTFGRLGWEVGEIGYGMWGMADWKDTDPAENGPCLRHAVMHGCNFFDTAAIYGGGNSERLLGQLIRENCSRKLYAATKIPPKNMEWPSRPDFRVKDCYPPDYIREQIYKSMERTALDVLDLVQFHTWEDRWLLEDEFVNALLDLRQEGLVHGIGISLNRGEPWNGIEAVRSGLVDSVQMIYNIFDQSAEDRLFPACAEMNVAVIVRVPFDEGSLTGTLTADSSWPSADWRNWYFQRENLLPTLKRVEQLRRILPAGLTLAEVALRFVLNSSAVSTVIPGMRRVSHVESNMKASCSGPLSHELYTLLQKHRRD